MRKILLAVAAVLWVGSALAQQQVAVTQPPGCTSGSSCDASNFTITLPGGVIKPLYTSLRQRLTANLAMYVATTGTDSGNCQSSGTPCATLDYAMQIANYNIDMAGYLVTINLGAGVFAGASSASTATNAGPLLGQTFIAIQGAGSGSTTIRAQSGAYALYSKDWTSFTPSGITFDCAAGCAGGIYTSGLAHLDLGSDVTLGSGSNPFTGVAMLIATDGAGISQTATLTAASNASNLVSVSTGGRFENQGQETLFPNAVGFSISTGVYNAGSNGTINITGATFGGANVANVTGMKFFNDEGYITAGGVDPNTTMAALTSAISGTRWFTAGVDGAPLSLSTDTSGNITQNDNLQVLGKLSVGAGVSTVGQATALYGGTVQALAYQSLYAGLSKTSPGVVIGTDSTSSFAVLMGITGADSALKPLCLESDGTNWGLCVGMSGSGVGNVTMGSGKPFQWASTANAAGTPDTSLSRTAAGVVAIGNGTQGDASGTLNAASYQIAGVANGTAFTKNASASGATVASVTGSFTTNDAACIADTSGTVKDCGSAPGSGSGAPQTTTFSPGPLTSVAATIFGYNKIVKASTVDNITGSSFTFICAGGNPTVTIYECGPSTTCATPTTIGSVTVTAAGTAFGGMVSSSAIAAGDYIAASITAGGCASLDPTVNVALHAN
jgi:hypothetical protein